MSATTEEVNNSSPKPEDETSGESDVLFEWNGPVSKDEDVVVPTLVEVGEKDNHPLVVEEETKVVEETPLDQSLDVIDPLAMLKMDSEKQQISAQLNIGISNKKDLKFLNWNQKKQLYLKKYTTNKKVPIVSKIIMEEQGTSGKLITMEDRLKLRLASLEKDQNVETSLLTQKESIKHLESLNEELSNAWARNDRVYALKIVIKCTKMLGRNSVPQFYPSMFILVSEVLETFGKLVFERIKEKGTIRHSATNKLVSKLGRQFTAKDVPNAAKEICRNWFYKVSSIRELIARIYVEMAILGSHKFLIDSEERVVEEFRRLGSTIRGLGDPLVASFARCYLARKGVEMVPKHSDYLLELFEDMINTFIQIETPSFEDYLKKIEMERHEYFDLFFPAIEWIVEALGSNGSNELFGKCLDLYKKNSNDCMLLTCLIRSFEPHIVANKATELVELILASTDKTMSHLEAFRSLGVKFVICPPNEYSGLTKEQNQLKMLNEIWKHVTVVKDLEKYIRVAEVYIEYVQKNFSQNEVNIFLRDLHKHIQDAQSSEDETVQEPDQAVEQEATQEQTPTKSKKSPDVSKSNKLENDLKNILLVVLENAKDFIDVFNMEYFLPIFDMLKAQTRIEVTKAMLLALSRKSEPINDAVIINSLFDLAKAVHDSVNILSPKEEYKQVEQALCSFVLKVDYGTMYDRQLAFYVDCRKIFSNFDAIKEAVIMGTLRMSAQTLSVIKGQHTKKTLNFAKSCMAFCHITVPAVEDVLLRLKLFLTCAEVSLMNNLVPQAEVLIQAALKDVSLVPAFLTHDDNTIHSTEPQLIEFLLTLSSLLIAVPGHPEQGPFFLIRAAMNVVQNHEWNEGSTARIVIFSKMINMLGRGFYNNQPPYKFKNVLGNEDLFAIDDKYRQSVEKMGTALFNIILKDIKTLSNDPDASMTVKLCEAVISVIASLDGSNGPDVSNKRTELLSLCHQLSGNNPTLQRWVSSYN